MRLNGNPTLRRVINRSAKGEYSALDPNRVATMGGMISKSAMLCSVVAVAAIVAAVLLNRFVDTQNEGALTVMLLLLAASAIPMFVLSIIIIFAPGAAKVLAPIYCLFDGMAIGVVSGLVDMFYPGIAFMAFLGTILVFLVTLIVFRVVGQRLSHKFRAFFFISLFSIFALELIAYLLSLFIPAVGAFFANPWIQIGISALTILWATFMLLIDMDNMKRLEATRVDKKYEWLAAFALTTTLVWIYMEILELLLKILSIANRK